MPKDSENVFWNFGMIPKSAKKWDAKEENAVKNILLTNILFSGIFDWH
jgi:hypothetical protein